MKLKQTIKYTKRAAKFGWIIARNWRGLLDIFQEVKNNEQLSELQTLNEEAKACDECDEQSACDYHRAKLESIKQDLQTNR